MSYIFVLRLCCFLAETSFFKWKVERWKGKGVFRFFLRLEEGWLLWSEKWKLKFESFFRFISFIFPFCSFIYFVAGRLLEIEMWEVKSERCVFCFFKGKFWKVKNENWKVRGVFFVAKWELGNWKVKNFSFIIFIYSFFIFHLSSLIFLWQMVLNFETFSLFFFFSLFTSHLSFFIFFPVSENLLHKELFFCIFALIIFFIP